MENWSCLDKIFIGNIEFFCDMKYGNLSKEDVKRINPPYLETSTIKPAATQGSLNSLVYQEILRIYRDGRVERRYPYHARVPIMDNTVVMNPIGKKMVDYVFFKDKSQESED